LNSADYGRILRDGSSSGDDMVSTEVTNPEVHAEDSVTS